MDDEVRYVAIALREAATARIAAVDLRYYVQWMRDNAEKRIGHL